MKIFKKIMLTILFIILCILYINVMQDEPTPKQRQESLHNIYGEKAKYFIFSDFEGI